MGKITGLNPAIILLSLSVWGALMGIVGMIIALPCTSLMLSYYQRYIRIKEKEFSGGIEHSDFQHKEPFPVRQPAQIPLTASVATPRTIATKAPYGL